MSVARLSLSNESGIAIQILDLSRKVGQVHSTGRRRSSYLGPQIQTLLRYQTGRRRHPYWYPYAACGSVKCTTYAILDIVCMGGMTGTWIPV
jgi:hypothetical protein